MRRANRVESRVACVVAGLGILAGPWGCASSGQERQREQAAAARAQAEGQPQPVRIDPVRASMLRERSIELLQAAAASENPQLRANALEALDGLPSRLEPLAAAGLKDPNLGVRSVAAMTIGRSGLCELTPSVRPLLADPSPFVRASAIFALHACGEAVNPTPLARILLENPSPRVRAHAAFVLGELGNRSAIGLLREAAAQNMPRASESEVRLLRLQVAEAMVKLGEDDQLHTISAALYPSRPEDLEATALAAQILGQIGAESGIDELIYLTAFEDEGYRMPAEVRLAAAASLAQLGHPQGSFIADEYAEEDLEALRAQSAFVYGQTGKPETLPKLEALLEDPNPLVAVAAAAAVLDVTAPGVAAAGGN